MTTDSDLRKMCTGYGTIVSTKAIMDKATNQCKGYGFVDFDSSETAQKAVEALNAKGIQAQMAKVFSFLLTPRALPTPLGQICVVVNGRRR